MSRCHHVTRRSIFFLALCLVFAPATRNAAHAAELKVFASRAIWTVLTAIGPEFEKTSGYKLNATTGLSSEFVRRIDSGEAFDVIVAPAGSLEGLIKGIALRHSRRRDLQGDVVRELSWSVALPSRHQPRKRDAKFGPQRRPTESGLCSRYCDTQTRPRFAKATCRRAFCLNLENKLTTTTDWLADDAVPREPVSPWNSLLSREFAGKSA
jgi:hypothetical protein